MSWPANPIQGQQVTVNGFLYSYNASNQTWDRIGYTASGITTEETIVAKLTVLERAELGDIANVRISGGSAGQIIQTDGAGNLSWKTESVLTPGGSNTFIQFNDNGTTLGGVANFAFDKTSNTLTVDYANLVLNADASNQPNITTVGALSNLEVTGNLTVYGNTDLQGNLHIGGTVISDGKISASAYSAPAANNQVLLNKAGNIDGSANLTFTNSNTLAVIGNITATKDVIAANLTGTLTLTASNQPNISNVGTLGNLTVTNNVVATNIKVAFANANVYNAPNSTANTQILVNKAGNIGSYSNLFFDGNLLTVTGNIQARNANLGNAVVANYFLGNIAAGPQTGITSVGTLDSLTVTGNITSGNAALGNLAIANYFTGVLTSSSQPNITTVGSLTNLRVLGNANIDGNLYIGGTTIGVGGITAPSFTGNLNGNVSGVLTAPGLDKQMLFNKTGNVGASANITFTEGSGGLNPANLTVIGNIISNAISVVNIISAPNISGTFTASSGNQPNIVSVGTLNSLTLDGGDTIFRNTIIDTTTNVHIRGPLLPSGFEEYDIGSPEHHWRDLYLAGNTIRVGSTTISATSQGGIVVSGSVTATGGVSSDTTASGVPLATLSATSTGGVSTITFAAQTVPPYSVGGLVTIAGVTPTGYNGTYKVTVGTANSVSYLKTVVGSQAVAGTVVSGGNPPFTVTSTLMVANLNVELLQGYAPTTIDIANTIVQRDANSSFTANVITANSIVGTNPLIATVDIANTVLASSQSNITQVGTLISLDVLGTITGANLDINDFVDATFVRANLYDSDGYLGSRIVGEVDNAASANNVSGSNVVGQVSNALVAGTVYTHEQPEITSVGVLTDLHVSGDATIDGDLYVGGVTVSAGGLSASTITGTIDGTFVSPGANTEILYNKQGVIGSDSDFKYNQLTKSLSITGKLFSQDANLGNSIESNYFVGNGYYLSSIQGGNVIGAVPTANIAGTVTASSQPNITSTGTLTTLNVSGDAFVNGDLTVGGTTITQGGLSTSTLNIDKGAITTDQPFSINEQWSNGAVSFTSFQQEITDISSSPTSLLAEFNVNSINVFKIDKTGNLWANDITAGNIAGTITYTNQPYITSLGTLSSLDVTANITSGNANLGNVVTANYFYGNATYLTGLPSPTELKNQNNSSNIKIENDGNVTVSISGTTNVALFGGSNLTIKDTIISANANLGDRASANFFIGNGNSLANITGANVTGYVPLAVTANLAGNVVSSSQSNITSVGTLVSLSTTGTVNASLGNSVTSNYFIGRFATASNSQPNITSLGTLVSLSTTGAVNASLGNSVTSNYFIGDGSKLSSITGGNVTGSVPSATTATTAGIVTVAAQPTITSVGTLTELNVSGTTTTKDITVTGNLTVSGDTITANVTGLVVKDPMIEMGGNLNGVLNTNDGYDRGIIMHYYDTGTASQTDAFMGWDNSEKEFAFASKATIATNIATIVNLGNIKAGNANIASNLKVGGNLIGRLDATSNNQPNISNVGTLIGLKVGNTTNFATHGNGTIETNGNITISSGYYFVGDGSKLTGIDATTIKNGTSNVAVSPLNGNVVVTINNATIANIVSTGIIITGNANASSFNATSQFVSTVATGTAPLSVTSTTRISNLNVAYANVSDFGVVTTQTTGTFYPVFVNGNTTANYALASNANISFDAANGQLNATKLNARQIISTATTGTAPLVINSTTVVPNLNAATAVTATNIIGGLTGSLPYQSAANTTTMLSAGTSGQYLQTTGSGLQWATLNTDRISNGTSNVIINIASGNIVASVNGVGIANIAPGGITLSSGKVFTGNVTGEVTGNLTGNVTGNVTGLLRPPATTGLNVSDIVLATMASDDFFRIRVGGTAIDSGFVEFATADNGNEPITFSQYSGTFTTLTRTATILDASGNTSFPVLVTAPKFSGNLVGGGAGQVVYQSSANVTAFLAAGTNGQFLQTTGSGLQWGTLNADRISNGTSNVNINTSGGTVNTVVNGTTMMSISSTGITISGGLNATGPFTLEGFQQTVTSVPFTSGGTLATYLVSVGTIFYHSAAQANWTARFISFPTITASQSRTTVLTIMVQQGAIPYIPSTVTINDVTYTVTYVYGITPLGTANALDIFAFTVLQVNGAVTAVMGSYSTYF
jgi:hypothetical protein